MSRERPGPAGATGVRMRGAVEELLDRIERAVAAVSRDFDRWDEPHVHGPGLYFVVVDGAGIEAYADPMGDNRWPVEECPTVPGDLDRFVETATAVGLACDGAVVVTRDGVVREQMVRLHDLDGNRGGHDAIEYEDWMGARHMSAVEVSVRPAVIAAITLSEEDGRVTSFADGTVDGTRHETERSGR